ncbi:MAG: diacylglycerol kinase family lipid kinase [Anaerolineae bacterium]|jgi:YegS/Rv2252/BmrU family lipid kinase|nr:diacylglycerol kinase family lipid kinase [Anaerolineae bacterium]MDX9830051.1 diacylglycerol kinase family lipid kinase [Anaerolineae bacterium]
MRCKLIVNPQSGPWDVRSELAAVLNHLDNHGWKTSLHNTEQPGEATALARQAVHEKADAVLVVGGDGTINEVVNGLAKSPVALGVLPGGTGNVWAKALGLPTRSPLHLMPLLDSVRALVPGTTRRIDLGTANGRYFLQWTGLGLDAEVTYAMEPRTRRQRRLGIVAYLVAGVTTATHMAGTRTRIWIDDQRVYRRSILVVVSNSRIYSAGLTMATDARLDDGLLDVDVFAGTGFGDSMRTALGVITGLHVRDPRHSVYRGRSIHVESDRPLAVHVDGEPFGTTPLHCQVVPKGLTVLLPRHPRAELFAD